jgi:hypothetical protein
MSTCGISFGTSLRAAAGTSANEMRAAPMPPSRQTPSDSPSGSRSPRPGRIPGRARHPETARSFESSSGREAAIGERAPHRRCLRSGDAERGRLFCPGANRRPPELAKQQRRCRRPRPHLPRRRHCPLRRSGAEPVTWAGVHSSGIPALRNPANKAASNKARIFGTPKNWATFKRAMLE